MYWYKTLSLNQRINLKDCSKLICGMTWEQLLVFFSFKEAITLLHNKLKIEGFEV